MNLIHRGINSLIKLALKTACRIHTEALEKIPLKGPLISIINHINFIEAPILATFAAPRPMAPVAKVETWDNLVKRFLFDMWGGIPIKRGEADRSALRLVLEALEKEKIVGIAPEGTRSHHGGLQQGHPGVILMALKADVPILPVVIYGSERLWENLRRLKRTDIYIDVGDPFRIDSHGQSMAREVRQQITAEIMYQLAALLPPENRGIYADLQNATSHYLAFEPGASDNLSRAMA